MIRLFIYSLLWLSLFLSPSFAQDSVSFEMRLKSWERTIDKVEQENRVGPIMPEALEEVRGSLRQLRSATSEEIKLSQELLRGKKELLAALGDKPAEESGIKEDVTVSRERESLNKTISEIDGRIKQSQLIQSRAQALLDGFSRNQQAEKREVLFAKNTDFYALNFLPNLYGEVAAIDASQIKWIPTAFIGLAMLLLTLAYFMKRDWLRWPLALIPNGYPNRPSATLIYIAGLSALLLYAVRENLLTTQLIPNSYLAITLATVLPLAFALSLLFRRIKIFNQTVKSSDDDVVAPPRTRLWNALITLVQTGLMLCIPLALIGYTNLTAHFALGAFFALAAICLFFTLRHVSAWLHSQLTKSDEAEQKELSPLSISLLEPLFAIGCVVLALNLWGINNQQMQEWFEGYEQGIPIGSIYLDPTDILAGIAVFFVLYALTRLVQWFFSSRVFLYTNLNSGVKDAIIALTGYAGITLAILAALTTSGLDMSNLAIIAGALSVGIGFGLQAIFSNFVSGLILFFERPIKVGDWVVVGNQQGFVKKIRVRSTEIETFQNASIMIPNSQFISETVTNWTLNDAVGRVEIVVGVAYGSDTEKVRDILLEIAQNEERVRKRPEPVVLFQDFGDSALIFELRCFLKDIKTKPKVASDLRFAIDKAFRKHKISIPFPQRDLHVVSSVPMEVKS